MTREWLVKLRNDANKTHDEVATKVKISRQYYGMIESGIRNPSVDLAKKIASFLEFEWTLFFADKSNEMLLNKITKEVG
ncbi:MULTISPECIES: helix-turn-helix transcriptional regulator [Paenibacillus]|uniref:XRE family transcriptional regulator n=1 Tax=Paenibacillus polymyxa (strain SC2) TaxID=886882 RepID=E3E5A7_PAEPS|nr:MULTISPECIES: helix-turn-helix transcriptional regulator [Paenibacillus]ADO57467.1 XRE family transcriptional regulator [Paenibacillus polymyxa SC2]MCP3807172.1 helix-turn-helix transcriptional regulator [Paenibacillus sp. Lou8.1]WPQ55238.1 helix-turn-helix transcriptional regulator [Paenibacillus polymyxa]